jgi:exodeoxyribonuclease V beta subunit
MQTLNVHTVPLQGKNLIEASAGTGKTWTLSFLYLRFILEKGLNVSQILVVTYTNAATEELRDRIRQRLVLAKQAFNNPEQAEAEYLALIQNYPDPVNCIEKLNKAILSFDESTVFTIHGFCERALTEQAFEASLPFDHELMADDSRLMQNLADDYWRTHLQHASTAISQLLINENATPDTLLASIKPFVGKPYLKTQTQEKTPDFEALNDKHQALTQRFINEWTDTAEEALNLLKEYAGDLNAGKINKHVPGRLEKINAWLAGKTDVPIDALDKFTQSYINTAAKKGKTSPTHALFDVTEAFVESYRVFAEAQKQQFIAIQLELLNYLREKLPIIKHQRNVLSFDDLLLELQNALGKNPELASILQNKHPVALIDEFQDTDPIQYSIFASIYQQTKHSNKHASLFYVGDPKQAIYSFRGADIFTYLKAANAVDHQYTLETNYRSHPDLIDAFNLTYAEAKDPFQYEAIQYHPIQAGKSPDTFLVTPEHHKPLHFYHWQDEDKANKSDTSAFIAQTIAGEIAGLLMSSQQGQAYIQKATGQVPLQGNDFAILVRNHRQGSLMKHALSRLSVASVQQSQQSIFNTDEAHHLIVLLQAIAHNNDEGRLRYALVTALLGHTGDDLVEMPDSQFDAFFETFYQLHQSWLSHGFTPMFARLLRTFHIQERLLASDNGERKLTNLLHLGELLQCESRQQQHNQHSLIHWLKQQIDHTADEESQLRLESDENLVQIVTIHKSKGLEYPLVYCPFLWADDDQPHGKKPDLFMFHDPDSQAACLEAGSGHYAVHEAYARKESEAENQRLLYVALTRASLHCSIVMVSHGRNSLKSAIARLVWSNINAKDAQQSGQDILDELAQKSGGSIACKPLSLPDRLPRFTAQTNAITFKARIFPERNYSTAQQVSSFSALSAGKHSESPDYDHTGLIYTEKPEEDYKVFPKGARAGNCLHEMLEELDFTRPVTEQQEDVLIPTLTKWGYESVWLDSATALLQNSLDSKLKDGFKLAQLEQAQRLAETEFYFPVNDLNVDGLQQVLYRYLPKEWQNIRKATSQLNFEKLSGYMKGFIDLIYEHEGRYGVIDYKSNSLSDYGQDELHLAMASHHYYLQYLIYCIALHRHLKKAVKDYHWDTHVDGVFYLFLRGMEPDNNEPRGVFYHKPSLDLIEAIDELFG